MKLPLESTYFIAEIGANHEGYLARALGLIELAAASGADAVKFQHYTADTIASKIGFESITNLAHYTDNPHTIFGRYAVPWHWTEDLARMCQRMDVDFMSTPYSLEAVDHLDPYVSAFKIGSGDITYTQLIKRAASKGKPLIISTGASEMRDVIRAVQAGSTSNLCIMQCNTNYDPSVPNAQFLNLRVLSEYADLFPYATLGFSDHTVGHTAVLGAVALGARVIEKHFTDDRYRTGPDHPFATEPTEWNEMVEEVRQLEAALGSHTKRIEPNETETVVVQRRCLRAARDLPAGYVVTEHDFVALRPAPEGSFPPHLLHRLVGKRLAVDMKEGEEYETLSFEQA